MADLAVLNPSSISISVDVAVEAFYTNFPTFDSSLDSATLRLEVIRCIITTTPAVADFYYLMNEALPEKVLTIAINAEISEQCDFTFTEGVDSSLTSPWLTSEGSLDL